jgi:hypothetical protein
MNIVELAIGKHAEAIELAGVLLEKYAWHSICIYSTGR